MRKNIIAALLVASIVLSWIALHREVSPVTTQSHPIVDTGMLCYTNGFCIDFFNQLQCYEAFNSATKAQIFEAHLTIEERITSGINDDELLHRLTSTYVQRAQADQDMMLSDAENAQSVKSEERAEQCVESAIEHRSPSAKRRRP